MKSIQTKILTVVISGLLVITALVSFIAVSMSHDIMHKDADRILNNVTLKEAALLNDILGDVKKSSAIMEHYAKTELGSTDILRDPAALEQYLDKCHQMFSEIGLNTQNTRGFYLRIAPEFSNSTTGFYSLIRDGVIMEMPVTDLSTYPENDTRNVGWYYTPVKEGKALWLEPYLYPGHPVKMITYATPLYAGGQLFGVLGIDMDFDYLQKSVSDISVYENGYAQLLAPDGSTAYDSVNRADSADPHATASVRLENGMYLALRADYKDIQGELQPMLGYIVLAFLCVLALSIIYTVIVTRRIVRPLKELTRSAEQLSSGVDPSQLEQITLKTRDEVGTLAQVLQNTYHRIREYTSYIGTLAYRDSLTGIKNTTAYTEAIAELEKEINCGSPRFGVLVADINNLKHTNDTYGHDIGNRLIIHTARLLTGTFINSPVFRIGGDEFAVLLRGEDYENYRSLLEHLDATSAADSISVGKEERLCVSIARGVALYDSQIDQVYGDVFAKADHAMYLHKQSQKTPTR